MPKGYAPSVFVSSTCYDLSQIRADLKRFFEGIGLDPILSEIPSFPVSPHSDPISNCLDAVKERADIFVLVIGARYGSLAESGKSITNREYLEAKAKGIPIYVFVQKRILNILPVWETNPGSDYSNVVDTPKLFEFIKKLRSGNEHWVYEFEEVKGICDVLLVQLAHLFMDGLILRRRVLDLDATPLLSSLSGKSLRILFERGRAWEYRLFTSSLAHEIDLVKDVKWDFKYELKTLHMRRVQKLDVAKFLQEKLSTIKALVENVNNVVNTALQEALGPPGTPGNPEHIVYCAKRIAEIYRKFLLWSIEFACIEVDDNFKKLLSLMSTMSHEIITTLEGMSKKFDDEIDAAFQALENNEDRVNHLIVPLNIPTIEGFNEECERLTQWMGSEEYRWAD